MIFIYKSRDFPQVKPVIQVYTFITVIKGNDPMWPSLQTQKAHFTYWLPPAMHCDSQPLRGNSLLHRHRPLHQVYFFVHALYVRKIKIHLAATFCVSEGHLCLSPLSPHLCTIQWWVWGGLQLCSSKLQVLLLRQLGRKGVQQCEVENLPDEDGSLHKN